MFPSGVQCTHKMFQIYFHAFAAEKKTLTFVSSYLTSETNDDLLLDSTVRIKATDGNCFDTCSSGSVQV